MRILFVKTSLVFPRSSGHDVHTYFMMRGLQSLGHELALLTDQECSPEAIEGLSLERCETFGELPVPDALPVLPKLQRKFCSYWGIPEQKVAQVTALAKEFNADAVVVVGLEALPYLATVENCVRVWYAADEWFLHHMSMVFPTSPKSWREIKPALVKGLYERAFARSTDRVWVVSDHDRRATRWVMGRVEVDVIPNGVDSELYQPRTVEQIPKSCTFWGRLDFGPNIDALDWFARNVWGKVKESHPDAVFDVFGFKPTEVVNELAEAHGFQVVPNLPDIREAIATRQVVVLPFVSGAGIKNKLLEAASMAMPIVASSTALNGVSLPETPTILNAKSAADWQRHLEELWADEGRRQSLGERARQWVCDEHSWISAARKAEQSMESS